MSAGIASYHSSLLAKSGIDVEDDAAEIEQAVAHDLADGEAGSGMAICGDADGTLEVMALI